jgi:diaminopimelate epimerase
MPTSAGPSWPFAKYHGNGNDFLVGFDLPGFGARKAVALCDRHRGVGADGIMLIAPPAGGVRRLRIFNGDGSPATFSGNGIRSAARHLWRLGEPGRSLELRPPAGTVIVRRGAGDRTVLEFDPALLRKPGDPAASPFRPPPAFTSGFRVAFHIVLGNPHAIFRVADADAVPDRIAAACDRLRSPSPFFPDGVNVSLFSSLGDRRFRLRTWERGVGLSPSCASAASACFHAGQLLGFLPPQVLFVQDGGELRVSACHGSIAVDGPISLAFDGAI